MGVITEIYSGISNLREFLMQLVTGICAGLPLVLNLLVVPVSFVMLVGS
ncbi:MAG: hypothetical protein VB078_03835 [Clostridiaceae bacterium]|nr:hypothetical protein [Clostridiaceae bacterium]